MKILNCPFCGSHRVDICRTNEDSCWVECTWCGCHLSSGRLRSEAIKQWNTRARTIGYSQIINDDEKEINK